MLKLKLQYLATLCKELTPWKRPWCWERLKAGGEGDDRGWDGWMASPTQWTWVWVNSGSWWWTGKTACSSPLDCKEIQSVHPSPKYSLEELMLKLKLQYFGYLGTELTHLKRPWCCERLKAGGEGDDRGWDGWMASLTLWTWVWVSSGSWWWTGKPVVLQSMGVLKSQTQLSDWTELTV